MEDSTGTGNSDTHPVLKIFVQDGGRIICRIGQKAEETDDFVYIINEEGFREAIAKRLILRFVEDNTKSGGDADG